MWVCRLNTYYQRRRYVRVVAPILQEVVRKSNSIFHHLFPKIGFSTVFLLPSSYLYINFSFINLLFVRITIFMLLRLIKLYYSTNNYNQHYSETLVLISYCLEHRYLLIRLPNYHCSYIIRMHSITA